MWIELPNKTIWMLRFTTNHWAKVSKPSPDHNSDSGANVTVFFPREQLSGRLLGSLTRVLHLCGKREMGREESQADGRLDKGKVKWTELRTVSQWAIHPPSNSSTTSEDFLSHIKWNSNLLSLPSGLRDPVAAHPALWNSPSFTPFSFFYIGTKHKS